MITLLARAGVRGSAAREALRVLVVYPIGFAAFATRVPVDAGVAWEAASEKMLDNFTTGLRWLLTGIVATSPAPAASIRR